jgi:hypothetical protein
MTAASLWRGLWPQSQWRAMTPENHYLTIATAVLLLLLLMWGWWEVTQ